MAEFDGEIAGISFLVAGENVMVLTDDGMRVLGIEDVFKLAEFAGAAHAALTGAPYVHMEYDKGEFVVKEGVPAIPKRGARLPFFSDKMDSVHDDGNGLERDCE